MKRTLIAISMMSILILTACGGGNSNVTPTMDLNAIQTQAIETFSVAATQTALAAPPTLFPTLTASPAVPTLDTSAITLPATVPAVSQPTSAATKSCYSMAFVSDVTIPDNTPVAPGQTFTKTWKVVNNGSCAWDAGFKFAFTGGEQMSGATYTLPAAVAINATIDLSITMTAPTNKTGALRGNWRMQTAGGQFFGDEVFVIVVVGGGTITPSPTGAPPTATATATATQETPASP